MFTILPLCSLLTWWVHKSQPHTKWHCNEKATERSQRILRICIPLITWPLPSSNSIGSPLSKLESNTVPSVSFPYTEFQKHSMVDSSKFANREHQKGKKKKKCEHVHGNTKEIITCPWKKRLQLFSMSFLLYSNKIILVI